MSQFKRGMKVCCIWDGAWRANPNLVSDGPKKGDILTIRDIGTGLTDGGEYLTFIETKHNIWKRRFFGLYLQQTEAETWFSSSNFRPLVSESSSLAIFRKLVEPGLLKRTRETVE